MRDGRARPTVRSRARPHRGGHAISSAPVREGSPAIAGEHAELASFDTAAYLARAVAATRAHGFVPADTTDAQPTWLAAMDGGLAEPSAADARRAHEILGWARSLHPREADGYRARLAACLARDRLSTRDLPLAASAVRAFNLHLHYEIRGRRSRTRREAAGEPAPARRRDRSHAGG